MQLTHNIAVRFADFATVFTPGSEWPGKLLARHVGEASPGVAAESALTMAEMTGDRNLGKILEILSQAHEKLVQVDPAKAKALRRRSKDTILSPTADLKHYLHSVNVASRLEGSAIS